MLLRGACGDAIGLLFSAKAIGTPIAELLLKRFVGEPAAAAGKGLIEIAAKAIEDGATQYEATLRFEELANKVVKRIQPLFHNLPDNDAEAIAHELGTTLGQSLSIEFLIEKDLDPAKLTAAFRKSRPLPHAVFGADEIALYNRALEETARYVVGIANKLPRFEPTAASAVLGRLSRMGDEIEQVLDGVARIEHALAAAKDEAAARANRFEGDYRQAVIRNLDFLELFGADISEEARRHRLSVGYISLTFSAFDSGETRETFNADRLFATLASGSGRLLIRGEAGSGKSTLMRWAAIENASFHSSGQYQTLLESFRSKLRARSSNIGTRDNDYQWISAISAALLSPTAPPIPAVAALVTSSFLSTSLASSWVAISRLARVGRVPFFVRLRDCRDGKLPLPNELPPKSHVNSATRRESGSSQCSR